jgi:hypothetical protein
MSLALEASRHLHIAALVALMPILDWEYGVDGRHAFLESYRMKSMMATRVRSLCEKRLQE